jgi:peptidyl-dipeptidase Dcp
MTSDSDRHPPERPAIRRAILGSILLAMTLQPTVASATSLSDAWAGPYGGVPPFDRARVADFAPAVEQAMAEQLAAIDRIVADPATPTFANTVAAYERAGRPLDRALTVYGVFCSSLSDEPLQAVERELAPKLAAFQDRVVQNAGFFRRVAAVHESAERAGIGPEERRAAKV